MKSIKVTRGDCSWFVKASNKKIVEETCKQQGWKFDSIEDVPQIAFYTALCRQWGLGELIDVIGNE